MSDHKFMHLHFPYCSLHSYNKFSTYLRWLGQISHLCIRKDSISASSRDLFVGYSQTLEILRKRNKLAGMTLRVPKIKDYWKGGKNKRTCHEHHDSYNLQSYQGAYTLLRPQVPGEHLTGWAYRAPGVEKGEGEEHLASVASVLWDSTTHPKHTVWAISQKREWFTKRTLGSRSGSQTTMYVYFSVYLPPRLKAFRAGIMNFHLVFQMTGAWHSIGAS